MAEVVLATALDEHGILATDLQSGAVVNTFEEGVAQPGAFGIIGCSCSYIFAAQAKKALWHVWAWGDKKPCYRASLPERMTAMAFTSRAELCFGGSASGSIYVWQLGTGTLLRCWPAHYREVTQLMVSLDESFLISASVDATVHVFNMADIFADVPPKPFHTCAGHALSVTSLALLPGVGLQQSFATASLDRSVRVWDVGTGKVLATHLLPEPVHDLSAGSQDLLCACGNGELRSLDARGPVGSGALFEGHTSAVLGCALSFDGSQVVSCSSTDRVRIWDARTRQCTSQLHATLDVQISSVKIVQCTANRLRLPPFQPFQRILTTPHDAPPTALCVQGREALIGELTSRACVSDFVDSVLVSQAEEVDAASQVVELEVLRTEKARWANAASGLWQVLIEAGLAPFQKSDDKATAVDLSSACSISENAPTCSQPDEDSARALGVNWPEVESALGDTSVTHSQHETDVTPLAVDKVCPEPDILADFGSVDHEGRKRKSGQARRASGSKKKKS